MLTLDRSSEPVASIVIPTVDNLVMLADCLEAIARSTHGAVTPYEVVVIFQEMNPSIIHTFVRNVRGLIALEVGVNLGFGAANNFAVRHAKGKYLVFLNDDTQVQDGWLEALIRAAEANPSIGAVGSRLVYPDHKFQEAGALLWSDGTTLCPGRGAEARSLAYSYVREVDYVSANGMLMPRETFDAVGGFDEQFYPGYYEDVDLCLAVRHHLQLKIFYEPRSVIIHAESSTTSKNSDFRSFLFRRHRSKFCSKWEHVLSNYPPPRPESPQAIHAAILARRGCSARILVIDDQMPNRGAGSGFGRAADLLRDLHTPEFAITLYPSNEKVVPHTNGEAGLGVAVVLEPLDAHLQRAENKYDAVIISRPHNFQRHFETVCRELPDAPIIYDIEALYHKRIRIQALLESDPERRRKIEIEADEMEELEARIVCSADRLVAISHEELQWVKALRDHAPVDFIRPLLRDISMTASNISHRRGAVFVAGWLAGRESPNIDALRWYTELVLPHVLAAIPDFKTFVTGAKPPLEVQLLESENIVLTGFVSSLEEAYAKARVAIAPIRAGAGVKNKTMEALQFGVPVVATSVGAEGLGLQDGTAIDITDDAIEFAERLIALCLDASTWSERREAIEKTVLEWETQRTSLYHVVKNVLTDERGGDPFAPIDEYVAGLEMSIIQLREEVFAVQRSLDEANLSMTVGGDTADLRDPHLHGPGDKETRDKSRARKALERIRDDANGELAEGYEKHVSDLERDAVDLRRAHADLYKQLSDAGDSRSLAEG